MLPKGTVSSGTTDRERGMGPPAPRLLGASYDDDDNPLTREPDTYIELAFSDWESNGYDLYFQTVIRSAVMNFEAVFGN